MSGWAAAVIVLLALGWGGQTMAILWWIHRRLERVEGEIKAAYLDPDWPTLPEPYDE